MDTAADPTATVAAPIRAVLDEIHRTGTVRDAGGAQRALHSNVSRDEGDQLSRLIAADPAIRTTLEVGCAYGVSALHICAALAGRPGAGHTIIDPAQMEAWEGIGVAQLERAGIDFYELITQPSELAMPDLLRARGPGSYDFIFIDGWHTFDQVVVDLYFANRLLRTGGYIAVDDCDWPGISTALSYFATYPHLELVGAAAPPAASLRRRAIATVRRLLPARLARWILPAGVYLQQYARVRHPSLRILRKTGDDDRRFDFYRGL